jgi:hypothetical protein
MLDPPNASDIEDSNIEVSMNEHPRLDQVRQDLEVIRSAAGFGQPPLGREDVQVFRLLGSMGLLWAVFASVWGNLPVHGLTLFALGASVLGLLVYHFAFGRSMDRTVTRERVYRGSWRLGLVLGLLIGGFYVWAKFFGGLQGTAFLGASLLFSGALLVILAVTDRWRWFFWGWAIPMLAVGVSVPFMPEPVLSLSLGLMMGAGGLASAEILAWQLRAVKDGGAS